ncbi:MAG: hypothetical protein Q4B63_04870 [Clostridium perfringens]|nr:hypothetical protein [Clostridium perfringens]
MIDINNFIDITLLRLKSLDVEQGVSLLTFKKDRKVTIIKKNNSFSVYEDGFSKEIFFNLNIKDLRKLLKALARKEFPRSNKLHFEIIK